LQQLKEDLEWTKKEGRLREEGEEDDRKADSEGSADLRSQAATAYEELYKPLRAQFNRLQNPAGFLDSLRHESSSPYSLNEEELRIFNLLQGVDSEESMRQLLDQLTREANVVILDVTIPGRTPFNGAQKLGKVFTKYLLHALSFSDPQILSEKMAAVALIYEKLEFLSDKQRGQIGEDYALFSGYEMIGEIALCIRKQRQFNHMSQIPLRQEIPFDLERAKRERVNLEKLEEWEKKLTEILTPEEPFPLNAHQLAMLYRSQAELRDFLATHKSIIQQRKIRDALGAITTLPTEAIDSLPYISAAEIVKIVRGAPLADNQLDFLLGIADQHPNVSNLLVTTDTIRGLRRQIVQADQSENRELLKNLRKKIEPLATMLLEVDQGKNKEADSLYRKELDALLVEVQEKRPLKSKGLMLSQELEEND